MTAEEKETAGSVELRPVTDADREFLIRVITDIRSDELASTPWTDEQKRGFVEHQLDAQTLHYFNVYPEAVHDIILWNGEPSGRLFVDRGPDEIAILDISILSGLRGNGIGTFLIKQIQKEAASAGKRVRIFLESFNPYGKLFLDLGFSVTEEQGINLRYVWNP